MLWNATHGETEEMVRRQAAAMRVPLPDVIANKPELEFGNEFYLRAFYDLSSTRTSGMQTGRISFLSILSYAEYMEFESDDFEDLVYIMYAMDKIYIAHLIKKQKQELGKGM